MLLAFIPGAAWSVMVSIYQPLIVGSHGALYSDAARAMLTGANPWLVGPPAAIFAGPPTMLLPFVPTAFVNSDWVRIGWTVLDVVVAAWALRRLRLPAYWLIFPPLFEAIVLGHPEVLVLGLLVLRNPIGGLAMLIKPYAALPMLAERRWTWLAVGAIAGLITLPFLPWSLFVSELGHIGATIVRQNAGDSVFGQPVLMVVAAVALLALGLRRAAWLAVPILWPYAQPIYKSMSIPMLMPVIAIAWALPIPGATLVGLVVAAVLVQVERRRPLPAWLRRGIEPVSDYLPGLDATPTLAPAPARAIAASA
jgi:hypothetical protein